MNDTIWEVIGYIASSIVLISLLMSSLKKLRWINLLGATIFAVYAFIGIESIPTALMNVGIMIINIYYLYKMYSSKEYFTVMAIGKDTKYLESFLDFYNDDICKLTTINNFDLTEASMQLFVLRNMAPAGLFIGKEVDKKTFEITLDYAIPQYRDFKLGKYLFESQRRLFLDKGYETFVVKTDEPSHIKYVEKMGFSSTEKGIYTKKI